MVCTYRLDQSPLLQVVLSEVILWDAAQHQLGCFGLGFALHAAVHHQNRCSTVVVFEFVIRWLCFRTMQRWGRLYEGVNNTLHLARHQQPTLLAPGEGADTMGDTVEDMVHITV